MAMTATTQCAACIVPRVTVRCTNMHASIYIFTIYIHSSVIGKSANPHRDLI